MTTTDDADDDDGKPVEDKEVGDVARASRASSEVDGGTADVDALTKEVVKLKVETTAASPPETFEHVRSAVKPSAEIRHAHPARCRAFIERERHERGVHVLEEHVVDDANVKLFPELIGVPRGERAERPHRGRRQ